MFWIWLLLLSHKGNISNLKQLFNLERVILNNTAVVGAVMNLAHLSDIRGIGLSNTQVSGELMHLATLTQLRGLKLDGSNVTPGMITFISIICVCMYNKYTVCIFLLPLFPLTPLLGLWTVSSVPSVLNQFNVNILILGIYKYNTIHMTMMNVASEIDIPSFRARTGCEAVVVPEGWAAPLQPVVVIVNVSSGSGGKL